MVDVKHHEHHEHHKEDPFETLTLLLTAQLEGLRKDNILILERLSIQEKEQQERDKRYSEEIKALRELQEALIADLAHHKLEHPKPERPKPGKFYFVKSKHGRYIDMREQSGEQEVLSLSESFKDKNLKVYESSFLVEFIDNHDGFHMVKSKSGRYLDMRQEAATIDSITAVVQTEAVVKANAWAMDSYVVQLIESDDGYFLIKSKHGRYLDLRQEAATVDALPAITLSESFMKANFSWAKDSYLFKFIPAS